MIYVIVVRQIDAACRMLCFEICKDPGNCFAGDGRWGLVYAYLEVLGLSVSFNWQLRKPTWDARVLALIDRKIKRDIYIVNYYHPPWNVVGYREIARGYRGMCTFELKSSIRKVATRATI